MNEIEQMLDAYEVDVEFPEVSGMEHLQMLMTRSELHQLEQELDPTQQQRLKIADQKLLRQAHLFFAAIQRIADLPQWRQSEQATPDQWWWYLDVVSELPAGADIATAKSAAG